MFDVNLKNKKILIIGIPFLAIVCYYFSITYMAFNQLIDAGLKQIQEKIYPNIGKSSILELTIFPSLIELESIKMRLSEESLLRTILSTTGFILISVLFIFLPLVINSVICYELFINEDVSFWYPLIYSLILVKIFCNIIFFFCQVQ